jgi:hypothetical protein
MLHVWAGTGLLAAILAFLQISDVLGKLVRMSTEVMAVTAKRAPILTLAKQLHEAQVGNGPGAGRGRATTGAYTHVRHTGAPVCVTAGPPTGQIATHQPLCTCIAVPLPAPTALPHE